MKKNNHILILSPYFHPKQDGLGQYTKNFYCELRKNKDFNVSVLTSVDYKDCKDYENWSTIYPLIKSWKFDGLKHLIQQINKICPSTILIQFVPFMYSPRGGINFSLSLLIIYLRIFTKIKIHLMIHEISYPLETNIKAIIMNISHNLMFYLNTIGSHKVFTSTYRFVDLIHKKLLGLKRAIYLPVGSNIELQPIQIDNNEGLKYFVLFGSLHPSKNVHLILPKVLSFLEKKQSSIKCLYIGQPEKSILEILDSEHKMLAKKYLFCPGFLSDKEISHYYQSGSIALSYFSDGISSRRGSALTPLQHGCPLITTSHPDHTNDIFKKKDFIFLEEVEFFPYRLNEILEKAVHNFQNLNPKHINQYYETHFSWKKIVSLYQDQYFKS